MRQSVYLMQSLIILLYTTTCVFSIRNDEEAREIERILINEIMEPYQNEFIEDFFAGKSEITSSNPDYVRFCLYTDSGNPDAFFELEYNDSSSVERASVIPNAPWKVLIHGFTQSQNSSMPGVIKNAYLKSIARNTTKELNILVVDWGTLAYSFQNTILPNYTEAVRNVERVGTRTGEMIEFLLENQVISDITDVHIIGFSLGSHVAGSAGHYLKQRGLVLGRISGLDVAGPLFYAAVPNLSGRQLTRGDAAAVDVYHTSWGSYGVADNIGDADFHPNPGRNLILQTQPFCVTNILKSSVPLPQVCSHNMAPVFYALSILYPDITGCLASNRFVYRRKKADCRDHAQFGESWNPKDKGNFYLNIPRVLDSRKEIRGIPVYSNVAEIWKMFFG